MAQPETLNVGGVPEHFNLPWQLGIAGGEFAQQSLQLNWTDYPGGTGAMTKDLRSGTLDVAVLLTEGIVADICKGNPAKIVQPYVMTPLIWGIHVPAASSYQEVEELAGKRFAISRLGSGSHLMAFVHARQRGWNPESLQLITVGDMNGAREAFRKGEADAFMWEKAMIQPLVDAGEFRRVGECPTPWPCFVIAARDEVIRQRPAALRRMLSVINRASKDFMQRPDAVSLVTERYGIKPADAQAWYAHTRWSTGEGLPPGTLPLVMQTLTDLRLIEKSIGEAALYQPLSPW